MQPFRTLIVPFSLFFLVAATPVVQDQDPPQPRPNGKCCEPHRVFLGSVVGSPLCSRTDCQPNTSGIARCNGLVARDSVANAKCNIEENAYCNPNGMQPGVHLSDQVNCDYQACTPAGGTPDSGSKCVVTPAPNEPQVRIPYNKCAKNFTKC